MSIIVLEIINFHILIPYDIQIRFELHTVKSKSINICFLNIQSTYSYHEYFVTSKTNM